MTGSAQFFAGNFGGTGKARVLWFDSVADARAQANLFAIADAVEIRDLGSFYAEPLDTTTDDGENAFQVTGVNPGRFIRSKEALSSRFIDFSNPDLIWFSPDGYQTGLVERRIHTAATTLNVRVRFTTSLGVSAINEVCLIVDGVPQYIAWNGVEGVANGIYTIVDRVINLYAGMHDLILRDGPANCVGYPQYLSVLAKFIGFSANAEIVSYTQPNPIETTVIVTDSVGEGIGANHPTTEGYVCKLRDNHFDDSSFTVVGGGGEAIGYQFTFDPTMDLYARRIAAHCIGSKINRIYLQLGLNDYINRVALGQSAAQFGTRFGLLLDRIRIHVPKAIVIVASPTLMQADALGTWRTELANACSTRKWVRYVNGATQTAITAWADGLHPTAAQYAILYECIESILGMWCLGNLPSCVTSFLPDDSKNIQSGTSLASAYDQGTEQPFVQNSPSGQPYIRGQIVDNLNDGPGNCPYVQTSLTLSQSMLATFLATRVRCTIVILIRFDGAGGTQQAVLSGKATNTCSLVRMADNSIQYYSSGFTSISAAPPVGWHVYEISRWDTASYAWIRVDGGPEIEATGLTQSPIDGIAFGRENGNSLFPANASFAEIALVPGDPGEGVTQRGRLTNAVGRARYIRHCLARYNITIAS